MEPLPLRERAIKTIKWLVLFVIVLAWFKPRIDGRPPDPTLAFFVAMPLYIALYRLFYGSGDELLEGIKYSLTPDWLSLVFGELGRDLLTSAKLFLWLVLCGGAAWQVLAYYRHVFALGHPA